MERRRVKNTYQLSKLQEEKTIVSKIFEKGEVYLYGAGDYGIQYLKKLLVWGYKPKAFVVSDGQRKNDVICGFKVYELSEVENDINAGFIITTNPGLQEILSLKLEQKVFSGIIKEYAYRVRSYLCKPDEYKRMFQKLLRGCFSKCIL